MRIHFDASCLSLDMPWDAVMRLVVDIPCPCPTQSNPDRGVLLCRLCGIFVICLKVFDRPQTEGKSWNI
jgi:hypothetical protein